jgi:hypothetical protein
MAYTSGGEIREWDYNILAWAGNSSGTYAASPNNLAYVWGVGTGQKGYGQDVSAFPVVTTGSLVTAASWSGLVYHVNKALGQQGQTQLANGSNIGIVSGETVTSFANVLTGTTQINSTALTFAARGSTTTGSNLTGTVSAPAAALVGGARTATFASADQARYFFNAGGQLNYHISTSTSGGSGSNQSVIRLINAVGGYGMLAANCTGRFGSGLTITTNETSGGYYDFPTSNQNRVKITDTGGTYTSNHLALRVVNNADTTRGANGTTVKMEFEFGIQDKPFDDAISVAWVVRMDIVKPSTTYLSDVWGSISIS